MIFSGMLRLTAKTGKFLLQNGYFSSAMRASPHQTIRFSLRNFSVLASHYF